MADSTPATSFPQTHSEIEMENQRYSPAITIDASRASSSSSTAADSINSSSGDYSHDVFINHRGPDTKKTFASYLYRRLLLHGFRPFLDMQVLQEGVNFYSQIVGAIRSASVHVAIFSPKYAESKWCLDELVLMQESGKPIIPIFYHVEPAELRWTTLDELQKKKTADSQPRYDSATLLKWRNALSAVAYTSGFDLKGKFNRCDLQFPLYGCYIHRVYDALPVVSIISMYNMHMRMMLCLWFQLFIYLFFWLNDQRRGSVTR